MRRFLMLVAGLALLAGVAATVSGGATEAKTRWVITDLGTLGGKGSKAYVKVYDINERGQIVGSSETASGNQHAFLWQDGRMRDLGTLGGSQSYAYAINERGQIIGDSDTKSGRSHAFLWEKGKMIDLGTQPGRTDSIAEAINERGQIVGDSYVPSVHPDEESHGQRAFLWQKGKMRDLGTLGGQSRASAINDRGQIVGDSETGSGDWSLFLWQNGKMRSLGIDLDDNAPVAINERGQITGTSGKERAFLWEKGKMIDLGTLSGKKYSYAQAITERGQIIGESEDGTSVYDNSDERAFLWQKGKMRNLGTLGGKGSWAAAINERGQIVGSSETGAKDKGPPDYMVGSMISHAFLWENGKMIDLGTLPGRKYSDAVASNERGQIIGQVGSRENIAVLWTLKP